MAVKKKMTLRDYLLLGYRGDEHDLFKTDSAAFYAESWDADQFARLIFHKDIKDINRKKIKKVFEILCANLDAEPNTYYEDDFIDYDDTNLYYENGSKKRRLIYNENYEIISPEEEEF